MTAPSEAPARGDAGWVNPRADDPWEEYDSDFNEDDDEDREADCGRWINGRLSSQCRLAGTEWCDFECPIGITPAGRSALAQGRSGGGAGT